ncbi:hypothetical protein ANN_19030 [Periplaneta americana]|uniref:Uncharacterized protein n=1 Tax=Periplaneta americana TaxID=6978 RepID=A0ABQ8SR45_PERAM|nr:hypothetical protein ANN_19030 [Periplaneta americana]
MDLREVEYDDRDWVNLAQDKRPMCVELEHDEKKSTTLVAKLGKRSLACLDIMGNREWKQKTGLFLLKRNPVTKASYNGWGDRRAKYKISPFWLYDRPPLLWHVEVRPTAGCSDHDKDRYTDQDQDHDHDKDYKKDNKDHDDDYKKDSKNTIRTMRKTKRTKRRIMKKDKKKVMIRTTRITIRNMIKEQRSSKDHDKDKDEDHGKYHDMDHDSVHYKDHNIHHDKNHKYHDHDNDHEKNYKNQDKT